MDTACLRKAFALIAKGLAEKEQLLQKEPARYPYSKALQHGINMFLAASCQAGCAQYVAQYADESSFLAHFITMPVAQWFGEWAPDAVDSQTLQEEPFYAYGAFAYCTGANTYRPSAECYEFLRSQDSDVMDGTDERVLYEMMIDLDQEAYVKVRRYVIENPIISLEQRRAMLLELAGNQAAADAFRFAYEEITGDCYRCPRCGWTMTKGKYVYSCHSTRCTDTAPVLTQDMKLSVSDGALYRLKKGIMRYFAAPGKLELDIVKHCERQKARWALWPQMDRFDVEIRFSDGEIWEIDAKAYRNPFALRAKLENDGGFPEGEYARGYVVVPDEYALSWRGGYTRIVGRALAKQKNVACLTLKELSAQIAAKEGGCREKG